MSPQTHRTACRLLAILVIIALSVRAADTLRATGAGAAQTQIPAEAAAFLARFHGDPASRRDILTQTGRQQAVAWLSAIVSRGQEGSATLDDWARMHEAADALIEVALLEGDPLKAAFHAGIQVHLYQTFDQDNARALTAAERALALKQEVDGQPAIDIEYSAVARTLLAIGRSVDALPHLREARARGGDRAARHWRDLVTATIATGQLDVARQEAEALTLATRSLGQEAQADAALASAAVAAAGADFTAALGALQRASTLTKDLPARAFDVTAAMAALLLDAARALPYDEAMALADRVTREFSDLPVDLRPVARAAATLRRRLAGDIDAVIRERSSAIDAERRAGRVTGQIQAMRELAAVYASLNAWPEAAALTEDVLVLITVAPASSLPVDTAMVTHTMLGHAAIEMGDFERARQALNQAVATFTATTSAGARRELAAAYGEAVLGLARADSLDGKPEAALATLTRALDGAIEGAVFDRAGVLSRLARLERATDPAGAVARFEEAARLYERAGDRTSALGMRVQLLELLALNTGGDAERIRAARAQVAHVAAESVRLGQVDSTWRLRRVDGLLSEAAGDVTGAATHYATSMTALEDLRAGLSAGADRTALLDADAAQDVYRRLASLHLVAGRTDDAWRIVERGKARAFMEARAGSRPPPIDGPAGAALRTLEDDIAGLRVMMSPGFAGLQRGAAREPAALRGQLEALERRYAIERRRAASLTARPSDPLAADPITLEQVRELLPAGAALIEYALVPDGTLAFVVTATSVETVRWKADWSAVRRRVTTLRAQLSDLMGGGNLPETAAQVAADALPPELLARLPSGVDRLLLVPADVLTYVPFDVLPLPDRRQVIDRFTVSYLPNASALQYLPAESTGDGSLFLGALGEARVEDWSPLPGTLTETSAILGEYPTATRVVEAAFTRRAALNALTRYDRVHFATHGILNSSSPMFSAVLMGTPDGDTRLSLYEMADLKVRARLVVLSACETGLGRLQRGDEITGLTRTLLQAGARSVVSSLWSVADDSTAFLMTRFYRELNRGASTASALRTAALATRAEYGHPFFWAPFTLSGVQ